MRRAKVTLSHPLIARIIFERRKNLLRSIYHPYFVETFMVQSIWFLQNDFHLSVRPIPSRRLLKSEVKGNIITLKETFQECFCGTLKKRTYPRWRWWQGKGCLFIKRNPRHDWWGISKSASCGLSADAANIRQEIMKIIAKSIFKLFSGPVGRCFSQFLRHVFRQQDKFNKLLFPIVPIRV